MFFLKLILFLYFVLKPFYLLPSGLMQLADIMLLIVMLYLIYIKKIYINKSIKKLYLFILYCIICNLAWAVYLSDFSFVRASFFMGFNFFSIVVLVSLKNYLGIDFNKIIIKSINSTILIQIIYLIVFNNDIGRIKLGFNNPNQLGYFFLNIICIIALLCKGENLFKEILYINLAFILVLASLSKAAIISSVIVIIYFIFIKCSRKWKRNDKKIAYLILISGLFIFILNSSMSKENNLGQKVRSRFLQEENDAGLEARGYTRIIENKELVFLGAGEGGYDRFGGIEMHSTLGTILFSYGIIGFILFIVFLREALRNCNFNSYLIVLAILLYGLTHNGIRQFLFWFIFIIIKLEIEKKENKNESFIYI